MGSLFFRFLFWLGLDVSDGVGPLLWRPDFWRVDAGGKGRRYSFLGTGLGNCHSWSYSLFAYQVLLSRVEVFHGVSGCDSGRCFPAAVRSVRDRKSTRL